MIHHSGVSLEIIAWRKLGGDFNPFEKHIQLGNLPQQRDENQGTYIPKVNHQLEIPYIEVFKRLSDLTWVLKKLLSEIFPFTTTRRHRHLVIQRNRGKSKPRCSPPPSRCKVTAEVKKKGTMKKVRQKYSLMFKVFFWCFFVYSFLKVIPNNKQIATKDTIDFNAFLISLESRFEQKLPLNLNPKHRDVALKCVDTQHPQHHWTVRSDRIHRWIYMMNLREIHLHS